MSLAAHSLALARGAFVCGLALLLLLTPMCGALCHARLCQAPRHDAGTSSCHDSASAGLSDAAKGRIHSVQTCNFEELPAALPANSRAQSLVAMRFANSAGSALFLSAPVFANLLASWFPHHSAFPGNTPGQSPLVQTAGVPFLALRV